MDIFQTMVIWVVKFFKKGIQNYIEKNELQSKLLYFVNIHTRHSAELSKIGHHFRKIKSHISKLSKNVFYKKCASRYL